MKPYGRDFSPGVSIGLAADFLGRLEQLVTPENELKGKPDLKKQKKRVGEHYAEKAEVIIGSLAKINASIPELFYMRMLRSQNVLSEETVHKLTENLEAFRNHCKSKSSDVAQFAASLLAHLHSHKFDPDNSLVGLEASAKVVQLCCGEESATPAQSAGSMIKLIGMSSGQLRAKRPYSDGELVLVEVTPTNSEQLRTFKFGRVISCATDDSCVVSLLPTEKEPFQVRTKQIAPLHADVRRDLFQLRQMKALVKDPFQEVLMATVEKEIRMRLNVVLKENGLDVDLLNQCLQKGSKGFGFSDLRRLKALMSSLKGVENAPFLVPFSDAMADWAAKEANKFVADVEEDKYAVFMPVRVSLCKDIKSFPWTSIIRKRLVYAQAALDTALSDLYIMLKKIKDGKAKAELTAWWLDLIDTEITAFLKSKKYAFDMYPSDYTAQPPAPTSIGPIKFNLELIREILNRHNDKHQTRELINRLKAQIYPKIDEFIENCLFTIAEYVPGVEISRTRVDLQNLKESIDAHKNSLDAETSHWINELVKDLKYLLRMYELEDSGEKVLDVVPVSGLILSHFYRMENELKTVLELWEGYLVEQEKLRGTRNYERLKTKIYTWNVANITNPDYPRRIEVMKEFGGTSCIRQLATGAFFSAALTEHGEIFTWGKGRSGELGLGDKKVALEPTLVEALTHKKVIQIGCGGAQTAAVTEDGQLYCWGWLAHQNQTVLTPSLVEEVASLKIRQVAVASQHICVLTQTEEVWAWGKNDKGQLGIGNTKDKDKPTLVEALRGKHPCLLRADGAHTAVVTAQGEVYIWGQNDDSMLGVGITEPVVPTPARVQNLVGKVVVDCALGSRQNVALTDNGEVHMWGPNFGVTYVEDLGTTRVLKIACGQTFVVVQTHKEEVCTWLTPSIQSQKDFEDQTGGNPYLLKPSASSENVRKDRKPAAVLPSVTNAPHRLRVNVETVEEMRGKNVLQLCCGSVHAAVLVENPAFFGVPLEQCMQREKGRKIPSIVQKLVGYLTKKIEAESLFRLPGQSKIVAQLKSEFDRDEDVNLFRYKDAHIAATLLRNYLIALPEPLIPPAVHQQFMEAQLAWHHRHNVPLHVERIREVITSGSYLVNTLMPTPAAPPSGHPPLSSSAVGIGIGTGGSTSSMEREGRA